MIISEQRRKDLEATTKLYLEGYSEKSFDVSVEFVEYAGFYHLTNEFFESFLEFINISEENKVLSVLAGGDQILHLIQRGIKDIDTFDINRLTEYYALGFKKRAIECLSFEEYNKLFEYYKDSETLTHHRQHLDIEKFVIENMEEEYKWFWENLFYNLKQEGFDASIFHFAQGANILSKTPNSFMQEKEKYMELKRSLINTKVTFKQASIIDVPTKLKNQYDLIYLSNIMEYYYEWFGGFEHSDKALDLLKYIYDNNLKINGEILQTAIIGDFLTKLSVDGIKNDKKCKIDYFDVFVLKKGKKYDNV